MSDQYNLAISSLIDPTLTTSFDNAVTATIQQSMQPNHTINDNTTNNNPSNNQSNIHTNANVDGINSNGTIDSSNDSTASVDTISINTPADITPFTNLQSAPEVLSNKTSELSSETPTESVQPSDDELIQQIRVILQDADLATATAKQVRRQLEYHFDVDLNSRKEFVNEQIIDAFSELQGDNNPLDNSDDEQTEAGDSNNIQQELTQEVCWCNNNEL